VHLLYTHHLCSQSNAEASVACAQASQGQPAFHCQMSPSVSIVDVTFVALQGAVLSRPSAAQGL